MPNISEQNRGERAPLPNIPEGDLRHVIEQPFRADYEREALAEQAAKISGQAAVEGKPDKTAIPEDTHTEGGFRMKKKIVGEDEMKKTLSTMITGGTINPHEASELLGDQLDPNRPETIH